MTSPSGAGGPGSTGDLSRLGTVHLVAIGGAGMSVVAQMLHDRGVPVQGSDANDGPALRALAAQGIRTWIGHDAAHLQGAGTVVVSSAIRPDNVELRAARTAGLTVLHRSQALAALMADDLSVAVAGAHGKTTTSAMIAVGLLELGADPSFAIGGTLTTAAGAISGGRAAGGGVTVAEADESDGSFLSYSPTVAVVTNVEPDHLDHYGSREAFEDAFAAFAGRVRPGGALVACADDAGSARLAARRRQADGARTVTYGTSAEADVRLLLGEQSADASRARLVLPTLPLVTGARPGPAGGDAAGPATTAAPTTVDLVLGVPGVHNLRNAAAAVTVLVLLGHAPEAAAAAVGAFRGTGRRFELRGEVGGVRVVDDYAHHPTEVAALLAGARTVAGQGRVLVLFQPHLYSRTVAFAGEFAAALAAADEAVVCDVYAAREDPDPSVGPATIVDLAPSGSRLIGVGDRDTAARQLAERARPGDLILTVGAGDVTQAADVVLERLRTRTGERHGGGVR